MNEFIFFIQIFFIAGCALLAKRLGETALVAWIAIQAIVANLFVLKQIVLFGWDVTASDPFAIGGLLGLALLQEVHGKQAAEKATWICFLFMGFLALISQLHLAYEPSHYDSSQEAFVTLFSPTPRLLLASIVVFFLVQRVDIFLFNLLKLHMGWLNFAFRSAAVLVITQLVDTTLFSFLGLYGIVNSIYDIIVLSFTMKLIVIALNTSIIKWVKV